MKKQLERIMCGRHFRQVIFKQMTDIRLKYNLKKVDIDVMLYLSDCENQNTGSDIQRYLEINKGYLSQILDGLSKNGYVTAITDENDRRYVHYFLTDTASEITKEIEQNKDRINERVFAGLTEEEIESFRSISDKVLENIQSILKEKKD